jgi:nicotinic acid mononucleotide adenylyltransferase
VLPGLEVEISASAVRGRIREQIREYEGAQNAANGLDASLLPEAVFDYIRGHGLYR